MEYNGEQVLYILTPQSSDNHYDEIDAVVAGPKGLIRWDYTGYNEKNITLMFGDKPLLLATPRYGECTTCFRYFIAAGDAHIPDPKAMRDLENAANNTDGQLIEVIKKALPLISLFEHGIYSFKLEEKYPTDGEGKFFWHDLSHRKYYDSYYMNWAYSGPPQFLVPTQPVAMFDLKKVDYFRKRIQEGESFGGIVCPFSSHLNFLLDGHHRATAALLEGVKFTCLTISPSSLKLSDDKITIMKEHTSEAIHSLAKMPEKFSKAILSEEKDYGILSEKVFENYFPKVKGQQKKTVWPAIYQKKAAKYPTFEDLEKLNREKKEAEILALLQ